MQIVLKKSNDLDTKTAKVTIRIQKQLKLRSGYKNSQSDDLDSKIGTLTIWILKQQH
jgi:hypothetical protein